jgi:hypothetical protein
MLHAAALQQEGERLAAAAVAAETAVGRARVLAEQGDIGGARSELTAVLELWPLHDAARAEIDLLGRTVADRDKRLALAREAAKSGRLREASALALSLAEAGPAGDEPRLLLKEVRARMEMVTRGIDQVKSAMHGPQAATADGLRHLQRRIEELAKVQVDHEELQPLSAALGVEADGLLVFEAIQADLGKRALRVACQRFSELLALRPQLLAPERLDARLLAVADRLRQAAEEALAAGRLDEVDFCRAAVAEAAVAGSDLAARAAVLGEAVERNRARAEALVAEARKKLAERDLAAAEGLLDAARQLWVDGGSTRRLDDELRAVRAQEATLAHVAELTAERDFSGAQARLADLPPTPPMLRTRIFDMKQNLARAQGLEGAFLLRVDEGGEYLVLRGESISIGNVREGRTDLPVLAAIAGRHARIQRSVSFHGGLQDSIIAEGGEVRVGGAKVAQQTLHSGDRIQLGGSLQCQYAVPTSRSMTASLTLLAGFQVAGTDRILLLKDRGRDGRILLGPGKDVHVRVPAATGEVELFAHKTGQVRVRADGGGTIDGKPFSGEHPVAAGSTVTAMGISFVLLPWLRQ